MQGVQYLERTFKTDWRTGLRKFVGGGVTWSVHPGGGSLLMVDCADEKMLAQLQEIFRGFAEVEAAKQGKADRVQSKEYRGVTVWTFGPQECHAVIGQPARAGQPQGAAPGRAGPACGRQRREPGRRARVPGRPQGRRAPARRPWPSST